MLEGENADLADLAFGEIGRKSAPREKTLGDTNRSDFLPPMMSICTVRYNSLSFSLPLGDEASFRMPGGEIFVPSDGLRPT